MAGPAHVGADLCEQFERRVRRDAINLGQIHSAGEMVELRPNLECRDGAARFPGAPWSGQRRGRWRELCGQAVHMRGDRAVAGLELHLTHVEEFEILWHREEMFWAIVPG
jgi:hypothetical protein